VKINRRLALGVVASVPAGVLLARAGVAALGDTSVPATNPLHRFVGSWHGDVTVQRTGSEAVTYRQDNRFAWVLGNRFLEERGHDTNNSSFMGIWAFDEKANKYQAHYFIAPSGDVIVLAHVWDESKQSFTGSADLPGGLRMLAEDHFLGPDAYVWTITLQDSQRATLMRTQGKERRVRP